jgi:hypothetical protein
MTFTEATRRFISAAGTVHRPGFENFRSNMRAIVFTVVGPRLIEKMTAETQGAKN